MPGRALLDTSAAAALLRGDPALADRLDELDTAHTSVVVIGELIYGARVPANAEANLEQVAAFAAAVTVLPVDRPTSEVYARLKKSLREKGRPIPDNDLWIAAAAGRHGVALLHRDAHFSEVDELQSLTW